MESRDFISSNHIIANVVRTLDDEKFRKGFSKGWYISTIQDALQELAFDTFYEKITLDFKLPKNLRLAMPPNVFNVREIYVFNGDGCCSPQNSQIVHWKRLFNNKGKEGYTARVKDSVSGTQFNQSPFVADYHEWNHQGNEGRIKYYANIQNGTIMFSSSCENFTNVRITFNGSGAAVGDIPIIPKFFEEAIKDWVKEKFYEAMKGKDPRTFRGLWKEARDQRIDRIDGSWKKARQRISNMDSWEKTDLNEYISSIYHR